MKEFKPHFYAKEQMIFDPEDLVPFNRELQKIRKDAARRISFLQGFERRQYGEFDRKEVEEMLDAYKVRMCGLESFVPNEAQLLEESANYSKDSRLAFVTGEFEKALKSRHEHVLLENKHQRIRDENIVQNAEKLVQQFTTAYPELRNEKEIRVYARLGHMHSPPYHELARRGSTEVGRIFDSRPVVHGYTSEAKRMNQKETHNISEPRYRQVLARSLLESPLRRTLREKGVKSTLVTEIASRVISEKFHEDEIRGISEEIAKEQEAKPLAKTAEIVEMVLGKRVREKGLKLPQNEDEAEALIKKAYPKIDFSKPWWLGRRK
ncbi:MAG TPA: hypothetical protein VJI71_02865 [Candidatus Norongarragalinales archaeon]|nr:hypothetical protein [Candidatus Norongarragalinales archaeon]